MKVPIIKNSVLNKFKQLENAAVIANSRYATVSGYQYKRGNISGFMSGLGTLERKQEISATNSKFFNFFIGIFNKIIAKNSTKIDIYGERLEIKHKPIFWNEEKTLSKMDSMLEDIINNINNKDVVTSKSILFPFFNKK
ncbi:hypothetical protein IJD34_04720 [bacterium]|nr:hypothetical protein [bacterium]